MIKKCYRLIADKGFAEDVGCTLEQMNYLWDIDDNFTTKKEYLKVAKDYTSDFNQKFNTSFIYQELFGEPKDIGYRYCTECGETFWNDDEHDC